MPAGYVAEPRRVSGHVEASSEIIDDNCSMSTSLFSDINIFTLLCSPTALAISVLKQWLVKCRTCRSLHQKGRECMEWHLLTKGRACWRLRQNI